VRPLFGGIKAEAEDRQESGKRPARRAPRTDGGETGNGDRQEGRPTRPLFGADPEAPFGKTTIDLPRAARIAVDALLLPYGHHQAAEQHGVGVASIERLHRLRDKVSALEEAIRVELVAVPILCNGSRKLTDAWATRPMGVDRVEVQDADGWVWVLEAFRP
jgi:hypothetical protein